MASHSAHKNRSARRTRQLFHKRTRAATRTALEGGHRRLIFPDRFNSKPLPPPETPSFHPPNSEVAPPGEGLH